MNIRFVWLAITARSTRNSYSNYKILLEAFTFTSIPNWWLRLVIKVHEIPRVSTKDLDGAAQPAQPASTARMSCISSFGATLAAVCVSQRKKWAGSRVSRRSHISSEQFKAWIQCRSITWNFQHELSEKHLDALLSADFNPLFVIVPGLLYFQAGIEWQLLLINQFFFN